MNNNGSNLQNYLQEFLNSEYCEKVAGGFKYTYLHGNQCIKVYISNEEYSESTGNMLLELRRRVAESAETFYTSHLCKSAAM